MDRFVILEHDRDGIHWDLMLERGEVLRTWAIDAPISASIGEIFSCCWTVLMKSIFSTSWLNRLMITLSTAAASTLGGKS